MYGLDHPKSRWEFLQKAVEDNRAKILWDFQLQMDRLVLANQVDIAVVDKDQKIAMLIDVAMLSDSNTRKKYKKLEKYQSLKEE